MLPHYRLPELHPLVRTLAWCVSSSSLVHVPSPPNPALIEFNASIHIVDEAETAALGNIIENLKQDPGPLVHWMSLGKSQRLGHRFEQFWHFYWLQSRRSEHCLFNHQIHHRGITLGELDAVLYQGANHPVEHIELAYKFYLGAARSSAPLQSSQRWIGPNARDRLDLKLTQMSEKQLKMLDQASPCLPQTWNHKGYSRNLLMKGWLFYPMDEALPPPDVASNAHNRGLWLKPSQLETLAPDAQWLILPRNDWLNWVLFQADQHQLLTTTALIRALYQARSAGEGAIMFVQLGPSPVDDNFLEEQQRYVLVTDQWPATT